MLCAGCCRISASLSPRPPPVPTAAAQERPEVPGLIVRWLIVALSLLVAARFVPGMRIDGFGTLIFAAMLLGLVNAIVRPIVVLLTLPITLITLGLFLLVINAGMLGLVAWLLPQFSIDGFWAAVFGALLVSLTSWLASGFIGDQANYPDGR
ncbi:MAG: phage holin family protein [Gammaproteobacteria bacterium]|nr:phage holin family protein [Gammaproteobacteria bacterium]